MRVALYTRVSTDKQDHTNQVLELREVALRRDWTIVAEHVDDGVSGTKGRDKRPGLDTILKAATRGRIDCVAVWSTDRLSRSLTDLLSTLGTLQSARCDLYVHSQGVDTSTPGGKALFQMMGVFAELERSLIQERVHAGLNRARAQGKTLGRPPLPLATRDAARALRAQGAPFSAIGRHLSISAASAHKACHGEPA